MSGSLARAATAHSAVLVEPAQRITICRVNWRKARDLFVRTMPVIEAQGKSLPERILSVLTHDRYLRGGKRTKDAVRKYRAVALERLRHSIGSYEPIEIILPSFPLKCTHPLKMNGHRADMAEISAFAKFHELCEQIRRIYPSGAVIYIVQDGMLHFEDFGRCKTEVRQYASDLQQIVRLMGLQNEIKFLDLREEFEKQPDRCGALARARAEVAQEVQAPENQKHFEAVVSSSFAILKNSHLPREMVRRIFTLGEEQLCADEIITKRVFGARAAEAAIRFLAYDRAIEHLDLYTRIRRYALRGSVHTGPGRISIRFHAKGTCILPWMGVAVKEGDEMTVKYVCDVEHDPIYLPVYVQGAQHPLYFTTRACLQSGFCSSGAPDERPQR